jgi:thioredoxin-like negative regulator of GroEL
MKVYMYFCNPLVINVETCNVVLFSKPISTACKVSAMPTFQLYKDGKMIDSVVGYSLSKIEQMLQKAHVEESKKAE